MPSRRCGSLALGSPLVLITAWSLTAVAVILHIVTHPEVLVSGTFNLTWSVPEYFAWAGSRMFSQFMNETSARVR